MFDRAQSKNHWSNAFTYSALLFCQQIVNWITGEICVVLRCIAQANWPLSVQIFFYSKWRQLLSRMLGVCCRMPWEYFVVWDFVQDSVSEWKPDLKIDCFSRLAVSSEISDLCDVSDLLLFASNFYYCLPGGTLHALISNTSVTVIPWKLRFRILHEISCALVYLHNSGNDQRVVHGDLKTKNLFVTEDLHIRVGDFGAATLATKTSDRSTCMPNSDNLAHTILYAAPEFLTAIYSPRKRAMDVYRQVAVNVFLKSCFLCILRIAIRHTTFLISIDACSNVNNPGNDFLQTVKMMGK